MKIISRRHFIKTIAAGGAALSMGNILSCGSFNASLDKMDSEPVVSIVKVKNDNIDYAVREAIDLIGGIETVAKGKERIILKPNLVGPTPDDVTNPQVIDALAKLMIQAGKDVSIGEGSAAAKPNFRPGIFGNVCRTKDVKMLESIQKSVFDQLEYSELAKSLKVPLINLHVGDMVTVKIPNGFVYKEITYHRSLNETDLLCSVPMMKTHGLAGVTLGMKNLIGVYPGQVYGTVRSEVHSKAAKVEKSGTASAVIDMVMANKLGLVVVDATTAMQGQGPSVHQGGKLVKMGLIIAGSNPLATDMAAAYIMGFQPEEISTFAWAWKAGMAPERLDEIDIRGAGLNEVRQTFIRPKIYPWEMIKEYGPPC